MDTSAPQLIISKACEVDLETFGDSFRGVGYTKSSDEATERYALMLDVIREPDRQVSVLDLGCGLGHLLDFIQARPGYSRVSYVGVDISPRYVTAARVRQPHHTFVLADILEDGNSVPEADYVILNGLFNYRGTIPYDRMVEYWAQLVGRAFRYARLGMAFNVMSTLVDWERDDLFHLPMDVATRTVWKSLSRHFLVRHDYNAFEYTMYVYRHPFNVQAPHGHGES